MDGGGRRTTYRHLSDQWSDTAGLYRGLPRILDRLRILRRFQLRHQRTSCPRREAYGYFPATGNFKLVCLLHNDMTGIVHVLDAPQPLPHDQEFYDRLAQTEARTLLADRDSSTPKHLHSKNGVTVGGGEVVATGGGADTLSVMRFSEPVITVHAGDTVEWTNEDAVTPHTVTFGTEPQNPAPPSSNVTVDPDGALHGVLNSTSDSVHSGFLMAAPQDRTGLAQAAPGVTRFRVTFNKPGVYPYICALHDGLA
jgi:plastocyanin